MLPYVADDVGTVAFIDLTKLDMPAILDGLESLGAVPEGSAPAFRGKTVQTQQAFNELPRRGAGRAYVLLRASDFQNGGTSWLVDMANNGAPSAAAEVIRPWIETAIRVRALGDETDLLPKKLRPEGRVLLGAASDELLAKLVDSRLSHPREDAAAALAGLGDADVGFVAFGDADSRRVIRELFPTLPPPFAEIDGKLLADGVRWVAVTAKLSPKPTVALTIEAADPKVAATLSQSFDMAVGILKVMELGELMSQFPVHKARAAALLPALPFFKLAVVDSRLSLVLGDEDPEVSCARTLARQIIESIRYKEFLTRRMENFRQIALAMYQYADAKHSLPSAASYDDSGKPLLSWRVLILPYLGDDAAKLYKEFRLNEPWDSPHNLKLVDRMPAVYAEPDPLIRRVINGAGLTTAVVPTGKATVFDGPRRMKLREITDGTSNTAMFVEIAPNRAVIWTKPDDWQVDMKQPMAGVKRSDNGNFLIAFCDGSVRVYGSNYDPTEFSKLLTSQGGEVVNP